MEPPNFHVLYFGRNKSGDMYLLPVPGKKDEYFVVDTGVTTKVIPPFSLAAAGKKIVGLITTHADSDHYYGMRAMLQTKDLADGTPRWSPAWNSLRWLIFPKPLTGAKKESNTWNRTKKFLLEKVAKLATNRFWKKLDADKVVRHLKH
jgi:glyoxylase-like metal-dependent hydrolase (beta-lactamase superfamily II)